MGSCHVKWTRKRRGGSLESDELFINNILYEILDTVYKNRDKQSPYVFPNKAGGQFSKYTMDNIMPKLCKDAEVEPFGFNAIRHHVASLMVALMVAHKQKREFKAKAYHSQ